MKLSVFKKSFLFAAAALAFQVPAHAITISTNTTWAPPPPFTSGTITITDNVIILPGATLTIPAGITVVMNPGTYVAVESNVLNTTTSGGRLVMNGSKITGNNWYGINVIGNSSYGNSSVNSSGINTHNGYGVISQQDVRMAKATFTNATIEYSMYGVTNWNYSLQNLGAFPIDYQGDITSGGIIVATGCTFHNNAYASIRMHHYQNFVKTSPTTKINDYSSITGCTFLIDNNGSPGSSGAPIIRLHEVEGISILGNTFTVSLPGLGGSPGPWEGVYLESAGARVNSKCNSPFIIAGMPCPNQTPNTFNNTAFGVYAPSSAGGGGTHIITVNNNAFNNNAYAVNIYGYTNSQVLQNQISINATGTNRSGIAMEGSTGYLVQENTITTNSPMSSSNVYGIEVTNSTEAYNEVYKNKIVNTNYAIEANQNNRSTVTSTNGFKPLCNTMTNTIGDAFDYYITTGSGGTSGASAIHGTYASGNMVDAANTYSAFSTPGHNIVNPANYIYYFGVVGTAPSSSGISGNVILITPGVQNNNCPSKINTGAVLAVSAAQFSAATATLYPKIANASTQPGSNGYSDFDVYMAQYHDLVNARLNTLLGVYDSTGTNTDSTTDEMSGGITTDLDGAYDLLTNLPYDYTYQLTAADLQVQRHEFDDAANILSSIAPKFGLDADQSVDIDDYKQMVSILKDLYNAKYDWNALPSDEQDAVTNMADKFTKAGYIARGLLSTYNDVYFAPNLVPDNGSNGTGAAGATGNRLAQAFSNNLIVSPNPATDNITLSGLSAGTHDVTILDMSGKLVLSTTLADGANTMSVKSLTPGIYQVNFRAANGSQQSFKLTRK